MVHMPWRDVADADPVGFIYVTMEGKNWKLFLELLTKILKVHIQTKDINNLWLNFS